VVSRDRNNKENAMNQINDIGSDLEITRAPRRPSVGGEWLDGTLNGHRFQALVFPEHAENPEYEIGDSRISKLWVQRISDRAVVFNWDRGADVTASTPEAKAIVEFLCEGLASFAYPEV
jgi:hypothetical protein